MPPEKPNYRKDIDGLRAVAVLLILIFHAGYTQVAGGFIGVDVFFVISGFLITRNILREIEANDFSFADFYTRRARRLFPAFFFTLCLSSIVSFWLFSPADLERYAGSLLYSIISLSNFFFCDEAGYFTNSSDLKPLLHTWSLSVEEQFYLVWPALLVGLSLFRKKNVLPVFLVLAGAASIYICQTFLPTSPDTVFFLLPFRVFEFAIGGLCVWVVDLQPRNKRLLDFLLAIGLAMIIWSAVTYTSHTPMPGVLALVPCIGTALVIYAGQAPIVGWLLRNRAAVWLGNISYSVYLIHWPLFVFYKYWKFSPITESERVGLTLASVVLGYLMWKFIETPFRHPKTPHAKTDQIRFIAPMAALMLSFIAANAWGNKGWPSRLPEAFALTNDQIAAERSRYWTHFNKVDSGSILHGAPDAKNILLLGNSHAVDLTYALRQGGSKANFTFLESGFKCYNFGTTIFLADQDYCDATKKANLAKPGWAHANEIYLHDHWPQENLNDLKAMLLKIRALTKAKVYVFGPKMTFSKEVPDIARAHMRKASLNEFSKAFEMKRERVKINDDLREMFALPEWTDNNFVYIDVLETQCGIAMNCDVISRETSKFLYFDKGHFTAEGSAEFGVRLRKMHPELF